MEYRIFSGSITSEVCKMTAILHVFRPGIATTRRTCRKISGNGVSQQPLMGYRIPLNPGDLVGLELPIFPTGVLYPFSRSIIVIFMEYRIRGMLLSPTPTRAEALTL